MSYSDNRRALFVTGAIVVVALAAMATACVLVVRQREAARQHSASNVAPLAPEGFSIVAPSAAVTTAFRVATAARSSRGTPLSRKPDAKGGDSTLARALFVNQGMKEKRRFAGLAREAASGNNSALLYAQIMANKCNGVVLPVQSEGFKAGSATSYRSRLLAGMLKTCNQIASDPNYQYVQAYADSHSNDALVKGLADEIKRAFAGQGVQAALIVGLRGIRSRPTVATQGVVSNTFASLGVSDYYVETLLNSIASMPEMSRPKHLLMDTALTLFACDCGMPCGPRSALVASQCLVAGNCIPGADAGQLVRERMLNGQQWDDVMALLRYLRSVSASDGASY